MEANILNSNGDFDTDIDRDYSGCEVKIASIHGGIYEGSTKDKTRINQYDSFCSIFTDLKQQLKKTETPA